MRKLLIGLFLGIFIFGILSLGFAIAEDDTNQTAVCNSNNLSLCSNETSCDGAGGEWEDNVCSKEEQDNETEDDDDNETENETEDDEDSSCANITDKTLCEAKKNCDYNNTTQKCVKTAKTKKLKESLQAYLNSTECPEDCVCAGSTIKCETENGREMTVIAGKSGNVIIITKTANASTSVVLIKNSTGLYGNFSGKVKRIKYLPDEIKEKVLKKLKLTDATSSNIVLNEDGTYEMTINGKYRVLWLFPKKTTVVSEINSETGEVTVLKKPWWKFRAD
ncbi:MAG: hypothetical protein Q8N63_00750 [Nanoarchaeota archaeon]|nr:hypothetical protein [Nanoarchaeota archaeon]